MKPIFCLSLALSVYVHADFDEDDFLSGFEYLDEDFAEPAKEAPIPQKIDTPLTPQPKTPVVTQPKPAPKAIKSPSQSHPYYAASDSSNRLFASIGYLYWTAYEPGLHYALKKSEPLQGIQEYPINSSTGNSLNNSIEIYAVGTLIKPKFDYSSGVRADMMYQFKTAPWGLYGEYSYFQTSAKSTTYRPQTDYGYLTGLNVEQTTSVLCDHVDSKIDLNYQNGKFLFTTSFYPIKQLLLRISFGPHATWLKQTWHVDFLPIDDQLPYPPYNSSFSYNTFTNSSWAVGLFAGLKCEGHLGKGFSLFADAGIAGMSGQQKLRDTNQEPVTLDPSLMAVNYDLNQQEEYQFMGQGMLKAGLSYSYSMKHVAMRFEASYEFNALLNMIDLYRTQGVLNALNSSSYTSYQNNSLYLQGLTLKLGLGF
jgi:Legionella pneumophila major outer membrane protein precursor